MSISVKTSTAGYSTIIQPYYKLAAGAWLPLKKVYHKLDQGWVEVWPSEIVYTHYNIGTNLNIATLFNNPTEVGNYIFINEGTIQGVGTALRTGTLPAGSSLTIINNGIIAGNGGAGGQNGSDALLLEYPTLIRNDAGHIYGGGGGGGNGRGASFKSRGRRVTAYGGVGGTGQGPGAPGPGGPRVYIEEAVASNTPGGDPDGASSAGGSGGTWAQPGNPGLQDSWGNTLYGYIASYPPGVGGRAILGSSNMSSSSTGLDNVIGARV